MAIQKFQPKYKGAESWPLHDSPLSQWAGVFKHKSQTRGTEWHTQSQKRHRERTKKRRWGGCGGEGEDIRGKEMHWNVGDRQQ